MKVILNILTTFCLYAANVLAQRSFIGSPAPGATVHFGSQLTVQVVRPNSLQSSTEVGIAIGLLACPTSQEAVCPAPTSQLGRVLFTGQFAPTVHPGNSIYENFTLTVPSADSFGGATGRAQLAVVRLHLIGAGPSPVFEINNITVNLSN
ncbi:hypothetical protein C8R46DRAFT_1235882 [Mycena filopes]|nr:hypothetical protein C8R46DRAFT_1235882 [Mycena filopes]